MHSVDIWRGNRNNDKLSGPFSEPSIVVGYGEPMLRIVPQVNGSGYGLTVTDMQGRVLLLADKTKPGVGILEPSESVVYTVHQPYPRPEAEEP